MEEVLAKFDGEQFGITFASGIIYFEINDGIDAEKIAVNSLRLAKLIESLGMWRSYSLNMPKFPMLMFQVKKRKIRS